MAELRDAASFQAVLAAAGIDPDALVPDATGTLCANVDPARDTATADLPVLSGAGATDELRLRARIGQGGMGQILLAEQVPLRREVAVKRAVRGAKDRHEASSALIAEARVTGRLEHPSIVPVHALGRTHDGDALLVMKRIEGVAWGDVLTARPDCLHELDRHLDILDDVCHAVHFAHARGVLHRDLKPQNVMIGAFGEVYVLDWGIAVCVGDTVIPGAPHARDRSGISGTPQYMAPEMAVPDEALDARTDVYLLGGVLHVILTGKPPREGGSVAELLRAAHTAAPPALPAHLPADLAAICTRALARAPSDRFESAEAMRLALVDARRHSTARAIARAAADQLAVLRALIVDGGDDVDIARAFSACRFGFDQARAAWPGSSDAAAGLRDAIATMAQCEVRRGQLTAARALVAELADAPAPLRAELVALEQRVAREEAERRATDVQAGGRLRALAYAATAVVFFAFALGAFVFNRAGSREVGHLDLAALNATLALVFGVAWAWGRRGPAGAHVTGVYMGSAALALAAVAAIALALWRADTPVWPGLFTAQLLVGVVMLTLSQAYERGFAAAALPLLIGAGGVAAAPELALEINWICVAASLGVLGWRWRRSATPGGTGWAPPTP